MVCCMLHRLTFDNTRRLSSTAMAKGILINCYHNSATISLLNYDRKHNKLVALFTNIPHNF